MFYDDWRPYTSVGQRRRQAAQELAKLRKLGREVAPVAIEGRSIARTFWGKAWCENLELYSDFANRLPRGRTYVRNGSVVDLQIAPGVVEALVSGSSLYKVKVAIGAVPAAQWRAICRDSAGAIDSLVELLAGRFSQGVMTRICQQKTGLFPAPGEIKMACSCPDWATLCKHVAAVLYGIGARLDDAPELLFRLRKVDAKDLISEAGRGIPLARTGPRADRVLDSDGLSELFGLELGTGAAEDATEPVPVPAVRGKAAAGKAKRQAAGKARPKSRATKGAATARTTRGSEVAARTRGRKRDKVVARTGASQTAADGSRKAATRARKVAHRGQDDPEP